MTLRIKSVISVLIIMTSQQAIVASDNRAYEVSFNKSESTKVGIKNIRFSLFLRQKNFLKNQVSAYQKKL